MTIPSIRVAMMEGDAPRAAAERRENAALVERPQVTGLVVPRRRRSCGRAVASTAPLQAFPAGRRRFRVTLRCAATAAQRFALLASSILTNAMKSGRIKKGHMVSFSTSALR
jgi:hypothetical protein